MYLHLRIVYLLKPFVYQSQRDCELEKPSIQPQLSWNFNMATEVKQTNKDISVVYKKGYNLPSPRPLGVQSVVPPLPPLFSCLGVW